jgi:hypothetical protein
MITPLLISDRAAENVLLSLSKLPSLSEQVESVLFLNGLKAIKYWKEFYFEGSSASLRENFEAQRIEQCRITYGSRLILEGGIKKIVGYHSEYLPPKVPIDISLEKRTAMANAVLHYKAIEADLFCENSNSICNKSFRVQFFETMEHIGFVPLPKAKIGALCVAELSSNYVMTIIFESNIDAVDIFFPTSFNISLGIGKISSVRSVVTWLDKDVIKLKPALLIFGFNTYTTALSAGEAYVSLLAHKILIGEILTFFRKECIAYDTRF